MRTLRVKLNIPEEGDHRQARNAFTQISNIHADQAIFQVNQTPHITDEDWGFKIEYRANTGFIQTTSLKDIERVMAQVAHNRFERRINTSCT